MKIIQVPFSFHPDPVGGTEMYVRSLALALQIDGTQSVVAAPGERNYSYDHGGLSVRRFGVNPKVNDLRDLYGEGDVTAAVAFGHILDDEQPNLVHLHAFTRGASLLTVREAKRRGIPVIFTYHTPTVSCQRGTLLRWGRAVCDGNLDLHRCTCCTLHSLGMNRAGSLALGSLPPLIGRIIGKSGRLGDVWTALRMSELVNLRHNAFHTLMREVDHIVVLCRWTRDLLLRNNVPDSKITISPHGLAQPVAIEQKPASAVPPLRIAFLGRLDPTKGPDLLIKALRISPELPVELHLYGIAQGKAGIEYLRQLEILAQYDPRITFFSAIPGDQVIPLLSMYHVVAVPSQLLETGPLVVLEAFAAGVPVLGSRLGGIAELVTNEIDGLLLESDSPEAWHRVLERLLSEPGLLEGLRNRTRSPRPVTQVAQEMIMIYNTILAQSHSDIEEISQKTLNEHY